VKNFALTGICGFVAPRHLQAIKANGCQLKAACDLSDAAGVLDHYFPGTDFFTDEKSFFQHTAQIAARNELHYLSVCTPNHQHHHQVVKGLQSGLQVISEKPLVLHPAQLETLAREEEKNGSKIFTILQLRLHPQIVALKQKIEAEPVAHKRHIELRYITARGKWYFQSWKGREELSGGIATNIGIHFFDMLLWIFGPVQRQEVHMYTPEQASGFLELRDAYVHWTLSVQAEDLPEEARQKGQHSYRSMIIDGAAIEFSSGFEDLHTRSYEAILAGRGFGLQEAAPSIELAGQIRSTRPVSAPAASDIFKTTV
jgi:UDP-N-acetyl-2-amino-2-deoxyglucuronate dehydrogenase